jgi:hypothetical protein
MSMCMCERCDALIDSDEDCDCFVNSTKIGDMYVACENCRETMAENGEMDWETNTLTPSPESVAVAQMGSAP